MDVVRDGINGEQWLWVVREMRWQGALWRVILTFSTFDAHGAWTLRMECTLHRSGSVGLGVLISDAPGKPDDSRLPPPASSTQTFTETVPWLASLLGRSHLLRLGSTWNAFSFYAMVIIYAAVVTILAVGLHLVGAGPSLRGHGDPLLHSRSPRHASLATRFLTGIYYRPVLATSLAICFA